MERHSVEGGVTSILNPLALTYHFGQASATPDRRRAAKITEHPPHPTVRNHLVNEEGADNVMSEASFWEVQETHSRKREGGDRKPEARPTPSRREVGGSAEKINKFEKPPNSRKPWRIFRQRGRNQ